jgi:hypothetical protein
VEQGTKRVVKERPVAIAGEEDETRCREGTFASEVTLVRFNAMGCSEA